VLAEDSESADVTADLVDVGVRTKESDYTGRCEGKTVLVSAQPVRSRIWRWGSFVHGNCQFTREPEDRVWGEDENLIRWGIGDVFA